eukprot:Gb_17482 [translate_table: standard]
MRELLDKFEVFKEAKEVYRKEKQPQNTCLNTPKFDFSELEYIFKEIEIRHTHNNEEKTEEEKPEYEESQERDTQEEIIEYQTHKPMEDNQENERFYEIIYLEKPQAASISASTTITPLKCIDFLFDELTYKSVQLPINNEVEREESEYQGTQREYLVKGLLQQEDKGKCKQITKYISDEDREKDCFIRTNGDSNANLNLPFVGKSFQKLGTLDKWDTKEFQVDGKQENKRDNIPIPLKSDYPSPKKVEYKPYNRKPAMHPMRLLLTEKHKIPPSTKSDNLKRDRYGSGKGGNKYKDEKKKMKWQLRTSSEKIILHQQQNIIQEQNQGNTLTKPNNNARAILPKMSGDFEEAIFRNKACCVIRCKVNQTASMITHGSEELTSTKNSMADGVSKEIRVGGRDLELRPWRKRIEFDPLKHHSHFCPRVNPHVIEGAQSRYRKTFNTLSNSTYTSMISNFGFSAMGLEEQYIHLPLMRTTTNSTLNQVASEAGSVEEEVAPFDLIIYNNSTTPLLTNVNIPNQCRIFIQSSDPILFNDDHNYSFLEGNDIENGPDTLQRTGTVAQNTVRLTRVLEECDGRVKTNDVKLFGAELANEPFGSIPPSHLARGPPCSINATVQREATVEKALRPSD